MQPRTSPFPPAPLQYLTTQDWAAYTPDDHEAWSLLYARRMAALRPTASKVFLQGADAIGLAPDKVPDLAEVNRRLSERTGWSAVPVTGFLPARDFFACLAMRRFPTTVTIRSKDRLDYVPEPDIFHDVFGHVPLHAHKVFADFLQKFGAIAAVACTEHDVEKMARLFWFTVEFGLIREDGQVKIYGSGLISSQEDGAHALGESCERRPFNLEAVTAQPFAIDKLQDVLFVIDSYAQLFAAVQAL